MQVFEYVIMFNPKDNKKEKAKLLTQVSQVLATSKENATILAAREIPKDYLDRLEEVQVAVRPF